ncbi:DNA-binding protein [Romboutsia sedimentorum]|uniref:DNA-binding protein n=1 Tax=Romboutsia sedimentorum TaxID=1368474 RepID=A0ABT7E5Q1_9FIRM|nr:DNA-binding protein [Romboutsia sedimentorum]MDK2562212.1 DNA-binding protein [Romboutsia sedimentorum]
MINKDINTRTTITISKDLKSKIEILAKSDNRSMNNMIITILDSYIKENYYNDKE